MMKLRVFIVTMMLSSMVAVAQETYKEFHERIERSDHLSHADKKELVENMTRGGGADLYINGEKFLISKSPLSEYGNILFNDMLGPSAGLSFAYVWGDYSHTGGQIDYDWTLMDGKLYMTNIHHALPYIASPTARDAERNAKLYHWVIYSEDTIYNRIERLTGCEFTQTQVNNEPESWTSDLQVELPLSNFTGVLYAKRANTAPRPKKTDGKVEEDFPEYVKWYKEPIYKLIFENGVLITKVPMIEPIPLATIKRIAAGIVTSVVILALLLVICFIAKDNRRKRQYLQMYTALQHNQQQLVNAQIQEEEAQVTQLQNREEVLSIYRDNFTICNQRFNLHRWARRLDTMATSMHPAPLSATERKELSQLLDECFIQVNTNLRSEGKLTHDDMRCCLLALLGCSVQVIGMCIGSSAEAVKTRKSRLKEKLPKDIFEWVFAK